MLGRWADGAGAIRKTGASRRQRQPSQCSHTPHTPPAPPPQPGTHTLLSASFDRTVKIWSLDDGAYVDSLFGHQAEVSCAGAPGRCSSRTPGAGCAPWRALQLGHPTPWPSQPSRPPYSLHQCKLPGALASALGQPPQDALLAGASGPARPGRCRGSSASSCWAGCSLAGAVGGHPARREGHQLRPRPHVPRVEGPRGDAAGVQVRAASCGSGLAAAWGCCRCPRGALPLQPGDMRACAGRWRAGAGQGRAGQGWLRVLRPACGWCLAAGVGALGRPQVGAACRLPASQGAGGRRCASSQRLPLLGSPRPGVLPSALQGPQHRRGVLQVRDRH
jgi:hypothetical protein